MTEGYDRLELIGRGGFSTVHRARDVAFDRTVALKLLDVEADDDTIRRRFTRECELVGRLTGHPNVVTVFASGFDSETSRPFIAMEYCPGGSLAQRIGSGGPLGPEEAVGIAVKLAGALASAHRQGVIHRDVKPHNIVFTRTGEPALTDFGIAAVAGHSESSMSAQALTPLHAAPEMLRGEAASPGSDLYSLGSTLYTMLAGHPPFAAPEDTPYAVMGRVLHDPPPPIERDDVSEELWDVVEWALAKDVGDRPGGLVEFGEDLQRVARRERWQVPQMVLLEPSADAVPETGLDTRLETRPSGRSSPTVRRRRRRRLVGAGLVGLGAVLASLTWWAARPDGEPGLAKGSAESTTSTSVVDIGVGTTPLYGLQQPVEYPTDVEDLSPLLRTRLAEVPSRLSMISPGPFVVKEIGRPDLAGTPARFRQRFLNKTPVPGCATMLSDPLVLQGLVSRAYADSNLAVIVVATSFETPEQARQFFVGTSLDLGAGSEGCEGTVIDGGGTVSPADLTVRHRAIDLPGLEAVTDDYNTWTGGSQIPLATASYSVVVLRGEVVLQVLFASLGGLDLAPSQLSALTGSLIEAIG